MAPLFFDNIWEPQITGILIEIHEANKIKTTYVDRLKDSY